MLGSPKTVLEERLRTEEAHLCREAQALERQVQRLALHKAAAKAARERAEAQKAAETELLAWQEALRAEIERAIDRLNVQREAQLQECAAFEQKLHENINAMMAMQDSQQCA